MDQGAVAMIDILGFKGIWGSVPVEALLEKLMAMQKMLAEHAQSSSVALARQFGRPGRMRTPPRAIVRMLSDTIVFALAADLSDVPGDVKRDHFEGALVSLCAITVAHTLTVAAVAEPPLVYRGAIASGEFLIEDTFIIGPAVDAAAEWMTRADAAVTLLEPTRAAPLQQSCPVPVETRQPLILDYVVPLKGDTSALHRVVNPYATCGRPSEFHDVLDGMKRAFLRGSGDDVRRKEKNTLDFMATARNAS